MNRAVSIRAAALLAGLIIALASVASGQRPQSNAARRPAKSSKHTETRLYSPRIRSYALSFIVEGRVEAITARSITIKTARGIQYRFEIDDNTSILESGELVSFATMADVALTPSDLRLMDSVEIVVERANHRNIARIITRTAQAGALLARH
ncbi:MAG TPA: hypothetical protein VNN73_20375 [Blastocatellia bacterium]|nr:hypothetical protein [Blastocatellia bacterium]